MSAKVKTGSTVLMEQNFARLSGQHIGFIGNHTSLINDGTPTIQALLSHGDVKVQRLFAPEHGSFGVRDELVDDDKDPLSGLTIHSLYGENRKPTPAMLESVDTLVFELQDVGARFYTYSSTLLLSIDAAAQQGKRVLVLDRPNPIGGRICEGPLADEDRISFTAAHTIPIRHGLTLGELGLLYASEKGITGTVEVVQCDGLLRRHWFDETQIAWVNPSPAMRSVAAATLYPGVCLLEQTNISVGRGTARPFELVGAPYIRADEWSELFNSRAVPGIHVGAESFTPQSSKFAGERCHGLRLTVTDRDVLQSVYAGLALLTTLRDLYPGIFESAKSETLIANAETSEMIAGGKRSEIILDSWNPGIAGWSDRRSKFLIYED